jgi:ABC-type multidrug transport system fused ATPase/permease subunit
MDHRVLEILAVSTTELKALLVLFVMIVLFSFLKVAFAWGGMFMALVGFVLLRQGAREGSVAAGGSAKKAGILGRYSGSVGGFLILGGVTIAIIDIVQRGPRAYAEARAETERVTSKIVYTEETAAERQAKSDQELKQYVARYVKNTLRLVRESAQKSKDASEFQSVRERADLLLDAITTAENGNVDLSIAALTDLKKNLFKTLRSMRPADPKAETSPEFDELDWLHFEAGNAIHHLDRLRTALDEAKQPPAGKVAK